jgi:ComF family protein
MLRNMRGTSLFGNLAQRALGWLLPPACVGCGVRLPAAEPVGFCFACYNSLPWWDKTAVRPPELPLSVASFAAPLLYEGRIREVILRWKFHDQPTASRALAALLAPALPPAAVLVPVPVHPRRLRQRTYNHAALLAQELGKISGLPVNVLVLRRLRHGPLQASKTRAQRQKLAGSDFAAGPAVSGQHIVLIDDIWTTGATARACALALRRAGAARVDVRTLCYTPPGRDLSA